MTHDFSRLIRNQAGEVELIRGYLFDQSRMKEAEAALDRERQRLEDILKGTRAGTWEWNVQSGEVVFNERWAEIIGYRLAELAPLSINTWLERIHPDDLATSRQLLERHFRGELPDYDCDLRLRHRDGRWIWVQDRGKVVTWTSDGKPLLMRGTHLDINDRKQAEQRLKLAASVFTHVREGIIITTADGTIIDVNAAFTRITGYSREEILGQHTRMLQSGRQSRAFYVELWRSLSKQGYWSGELWNRRKNGELYATLLTISAVRDDQGTALHYVGLFSDITQIKQHQRQLEHLAHYDALTTLPNRVLLAERLQQAMVQARTKRRELAVVYLDLDGFKAINDRYGHQVGDQLLVALAARMRQELRPGDTLARLGGDEFVAVLVDLTDRDTTDRLLKQLLDAVNQSTNMTEFSQRVTVSIGVTLYPQAEEVDADQLLRQADQAMYQAKLAGKNRFYYFDAEHDRNARGRHESLEHIRQALEHGEFRLHYQPKVNMRSARVVGAEALIRWQHPERGLLPPAVFLPAIEDHPLGVELGDWVIDTALAQIDAWGAAGIDLPVSVNISACQLQQPDFVKHLGELLAAHPGVRPSRLELEVLETSAFEDMEHISQVIAECRALGVAVALDDFGTGYSSLTYLKRLPVDMVKIDQSFVRDMLDDPEDLAIVESVLGLSVAFRRRVIAEGVESEAHGELLLQLGCELAQGYGIARPMPPEAIPDWIDAWRPPDAWRHCSTIQRESLPLIHAIVEHRAWLGELSRTIEGEQAAPSRHRLHGCRFGEWLDQLKADSHSPGSAIQSIDALHRELHALGEALLALNAKGCGSEAQAHLSDLHRLSEDLSRAVQALLRAPS